MRDQDSDQPIHTWQPTHRQQRSTRSIHSTTRHSMPLRMRTSSSRKKYSKMLQPPRTMDIRGNFMFTVPLQFLRIENATKHFRNDAMYDIPLPGYYGPWPLLGLPSLSYYLRVVSSSRARTYDIVLSLGLAVAASLILRCELGVMVVCMTFGILLAHGQRIIKPIVIGGLVSALVSSGNLIVTDHDFEINFS